MFRKFFVHFSITLLSVLILSLLASTVSNPAAEQTEKSTYNTLLNEVERYEERSGYQLQLEDNDNVAVGIPKLSRVSESEIDAKLENKVKTGQHDLITNKEHKQGINVTLSPGMKVKNGRKVLEKTESNVALNRRRRERKLLLIEPGNVFEDEIISITHDPHHRAVLIRFEMKRCFHPVIRGRLSGPAVTLLTWTQEGSTVQGVYDVPVSGLYFLELTAIFCNQLDRNMNEDVVAKSCIEDVRRHRITVKGSYIRIMTLKGSHIKITSNSFGYWTATDEKKLSLYTRVQPPDCKLPSCNVKDLTSLDRFEGYKFVFNEIEIEKLKKQILMDERKFCFIGASHSRTIVELLADIFPSSQKFEHIYVEWPSDLVKASTLALSQGCTIAVVGIGQFPAGWPTGKPMSFKEYENEMRHALDGFSRITSKRVDLHVRNVHENSLGNKVSACPPEDWRNPEVIRLYNQILEEICFELGIKFIDTASIISPMYDSAPDWCHYKNSVGVAEVLYLVYRLMKL